MATNIADLSIGLSIDGGDKISETLKRVSDSMKNLAKSMPKIDLGAENKTLFSPEFKKKMDDGKKGFKSLFEHKPSDKTEKALKGVGDGLKGITSMSFEAKAAIIATLYALEQMFSKSGAVGTSMVNFAALTGMDTKTLQQYQYAARQVGITNEEMQGTFESLQSQASKIHMGGGASAQFAQFATTMGGVSKTEIDKWMTHPELFLQKLQQYAQKEKNVGVRNEVLTSMVGKNMAAGLARNAFNPGVLAQAPTYSKGALEGLDKANAMWTNLANHLQMATGFLGAKHGGPLVSTLQQLGDLGLKFIDVMLTMAEKFHIFDALKFVLKEISSLLDMASKAALEFGNYLGKIFTHLGFLEKFKKLFESVQDTTKKIVPIFVALYERLIAFLERSNALEYLIAIFDKLGSALVKIGKIILEVGDKFQVFNSLADEFKLIGDVAVGSFGLINDVLDKILAFVDEIKSPGEAIKKWIGSLGSMVGLPSIFTNFLTGAGKEGEKAGAKEETNKGPGLFSSFMSKMFGDNPPSKIPDSALKSEKHTEATLPVDENASKLALGENGNPILWEPNGPIVAPNLKLITPEGSLPRSSNWAPHTSHHMNTNAKTQNIEVNQNLNFAHEGKDSKQTSDAVKHSINHAFRTLNSQAQGS